MSDEQSFDDSSSGGGSLGDAASHLPVVGEPIGAANAAMGAMDKAAESPVDQGSDYGSPESEMGGNDSEGMPVEDMHEIADGASKVASATGHPLSGLFSGIQGAGSNIAAMGINAAHGVMNGAVAAGQGVLGFFGGIGSSISAMTGGAISTFAAGSAAAGSGLLGLAFLGNIIFGGMDPSLLDGGQPLNDCGQKVQAADADLDSAMTASSGQTSQQQEDSAKKIFSVLKKIGLSDAAIAGVLGNFSDESGLDPTSIETISLAAEPFQIGPKKKAAWKDDDFKIDKIDPSYAAEYPGIDAGGGIAGIGLGGWTNALNTRLLNFAKSKNGNWYDEKIQLEYMLGPDDKASVVKGMAGKSYSVDDATTYFLTAWEGNQGMQVGQRETFAHQWAAKIPNFTVDTDFANSVISQAGAAGSNAAADEVVNASADCQSATGTSADNSSLVNAAISYAWPFKNQSINDFSRGEDNRGTALYQAVHKEIWGSNTYQSTPLSSCDNGVSTAVLWSGTDKDYKEQNVQTQYQYLHGPGSASGEWKQIKWNGDTKNLQPGDVFIIYAGGNTHTFMYVGTKAPMNFYHNDQSKFEKDADTVSASHNPTGSTDITNRSPGLNNTFWGGTHGEYLGDWQEYEVWRATKSTGSKYTSFKPSVDSSKDNVTKDAIIPAEKGDQVQ